MSKLSYDGDIVLLLRAVGVTSYPDFYYLYTRATTFQDGDSVYDVIAYGRTPDGRAFEMKLRQLKEGIELRAIRPLSDDAFEERVRRLTEKNPR
jgi:hypothetical protein